ncbi:MAG: hypothetical protein WCK90_02455 [archaeon]
MVERPSTYREKLIEQPGQPVSAEILKSYLISVRDHSRETPNLVDITIRGRLGKMFAGDPKKVLERSLESLGKNHLDLNSAYDLALAAQRAQWYPLAREALEYISKRSKVVFADPERKRELDFVRGSVLESLKDHVAAWEVLGKYMKRDDLTEEESKLVKDTAANHASMSFAEGTTGGKIVTKESEALHNPEEQHKARITELEKKISEGNEAALENAASELAKIHCGAGNYIKAVEVLNQALKKRSNSSDLHRLRIEIELKGMDRELSILEDNERGAVNLKRTEYAVESYRWLAGTTGRSEDALSLGRSLYELGTIEKKIEGKETEAKNMFIEAIPHLQRKFQSENEILESMLLKTDCFLEVNLEEAAAFIAEGVLRRVGDRDERKDERVRARYALARAQEALGKVEEARVEYARVLAEDINFKDARERIKIRTNPES